MTHPRNTRLAASSILMPDISRRRFLQIGAAVATAGMFPRVVAQSNYRVGVGRGTLGYGATLRAMDASGEWPAVSGKIVVIKPNLVMSAPPESGAVTDPEVVRAVVDRALGDGATRVFIVEAGPDGAHFGIPGYGIFRDYDPDGRVQLSGLQTLPVIPAQNPDGWVYKKIYMAELLQRPGVVFINVAKLKVHMEATVTLSSKNIFGVPDVFSYLSDKYPTGRFAMHERGLSQAIFDVNLVRPTDFAVIDGIWGMEGLGPLYGTPVLMNTVLAGKNTVAVDRVALEIMQVGQQSVRHLNYLSAYGLGPYALDEIDIVGDSLSTHPFALPPLPPDFSPPQLSSSRLDTAKAETVTIWTDFSANCFRTVEILRMYDDRPDVELVRTLVPMSFQDMGLHVAGWDGRADDQTLVTPGRYAVRVTARASEGRGRPGAATSWVWVT